MNIRRKVFSIIEIDGEEKLFSLTEQREFAKAPGAGKGVRGGVKSSRRNISRNNAPNRVAQEVVKRTVEGKGNSVPRNAVGQTAKKRTEQIIGNAKKEVADDVSKKAGKLGKYGKAALITAAALTAAAGGKVLYDKNKKRKSLKGDE